MKEKVIFGFLLFSLILPLAHTSGSRDRSFDRYEETVYGVEEAFTSTDCRVIGSTYLVRIKKVIVNIII